MAIAPKSNAFIDALNASEIGAKISAELAEKATAERKLLADELSKLNDSAERDYPKIVAATEKAFAAFRDAEAKLQDAKNAALAANGARLAASARYTRRRAELEHELAQSASPLIAEFIVWCRDDMQATRRKFTSRSWDEKNQVTGARFPKSENNGASICARVAALFAAIEATNDMKLIADQSHVAAALEKIKADLPKVGGA
jgi:hypothetical protein